ncbi:MAG TPA: xanthine dehydrogenase family protein molybdopterin-binding subunit [Xanthobacteraceae bacterium]|nr:xanthine dehydrogenase family protein molybdopterin-binding subunit [Xanthobacteraceae bacterium]
MNVTMRPMKFGVGQPHRRIEDAALISGHGRYVADAVPEGALAAVVVRSPHAHARFRFTDLETAKKMPGVRLILTAADVADLAPLPCFGQIKPKDEEKMWVPPFPVLAADEVRFGGDAVAFVVADTLNAAKDAAEKIEIDWEPLPAVAETAGAVAGGAPLVWNERKQNVTYSAEHGDAAATARAFESAAKVVKIEIVNPRIVTNFMEPRGAIAELGPGEGRLTVTASTQGSHIVRGALAGILKMPPDKLRVVTHDVGGGFGTKAGPYREYALVAVAAQKLNRPVAWIADRSEHFLGDYQGRDNVTVAEMALDAAGNFLALRVDTLANMGAYLSFFAPFIPWNGATMLPGCYRIPAMHVRIRGVYTHTPPVDAYRGAGRPEATYVIERLVDAVARARGEGQDEVRRRNFIRPEEMPYKTATGRTYDSGEFLGHMERAQQIADWKGFEKRAAESKARGKLRGLGLASYIEACGGASAEKARLRLEPDGTVTLWIGTQSNGQGHKTTYAQIIAGELDIPLEQINVHQGDTDEIATGGGTIGSRSMPTGGVSVSKATKNLAENLKKLAADELEVAADDLEFVAGSVRVAGTNHAVSLQALGAKSDASLLSAEDQHAPSVGTYPNGTHICEVEVDPATGATKILRYTVVDDFGVTLNPLLLEGQVQGGIGQGIGQALFEHAVFDESGQLLTASFMDYAIPRADDTASYAFESRDVPCKTNPLGIKGAGEAGAIGSCPAIINAIVDALDRGFGITHIDMPATPEKVWRAIEGAGRKS